MIARKETSMLYLGAFVVLLLAGPAAGGPFDVPGYDKAFTCSVCHGFAGNSRAATVPILAGMAPGYLVKALRDYASGKRPLTEMEPYAKMAVQLGVDEVAGYFASQKREPHPPGWTAGRWRGARLPRPSALSAMAPTGEGMPPGTFPTCAPNPRGIS